MRAVREFLHDGNFMPIDCFLLWDLADKFFHGIVFPRFSIFHKTNKAVASFSQLFDFANFFAGDSMDGAPAKELENKLDAIAHL